MRPEPGKTICDPATGTGGFLLAAHDYIASHNTLDRDQWDHLRHQALHGWEIVDNTARLCVMNLYLHGIGSFGDGSELGRSPIHVSDSLASHPGEYFDIVLTNPPFGKKSSVTFVTDEGEIKRESQNIVREDFWTSTNNKDFSFVQHIKNILNMTGKAAVVVPDNVLFEGGAGEVVRRKLLHECDVHTLLRLPTGIFYAQGVKANVLFFDRKPASEAPWTKQLWIYDLRTNMDFTLKTNPLVRGNLDDFVECFHADNRFERTASWSPSEEVGRWRAFTYEELLARDKVNLDIFWLRDQLLKTQPICRTLSYRQQRSLRVPVCSRWRNSSPLRRSSMDKSSNLLHGKLTPMTTNKATAQSSPNIAFIKYWGNRDNTYRLPSNSSISMNLDGLFTRTTVSFTASKKDS